MKNLCSRVCRISNYADYRTEKYSFTFYSDPTLAYCDVGKSLDDMKRFVINLKRSVKVSYFWNFYFESSILPKNERKQFDLRYHSSRVEFSFVIWENWRYQKYIPKLTYSQVPNKRVYSFIQNKKVGLLFWANFIGLNKQVGWKIW